MKLQFGILFMFFCTCLTAQNKSITFGVKGGLNISSIENYGNNDKESRKTVHLGIMFEVPITDQFSFAPEILYSPQGEISNFETVNGKFEAITSLDYLQLPLIAKYYLTNSIALEAGPQIGFLLNTGSSLEANGEFNGDFETLFDEVFEEDFSTFDAGVSIGISYKFTESIVMQSRFIKGLVDINDTKISDAKFRNNVIQFSVGYFY